MRKKLLGLKPGPVESQAHELNHQATDASPGGLSPLMGDTPQQAPWDPQNGTGSIEA